MSTCFLKQTEHIFCFDYWCLDSNAGLWPKIIKCCLAIILEMCFMKEIWYKVVKVDYFALSYMLPGVCFGMRRHMALLRRPVMY